MKPEYIKVSHCRVCGSDNISDSIVNKNYYLINLNQTIHLSYVVCQECQFIFQGEYVGDKFAEEARSIHYDKKSSKSIYGKATHEQTEELQEEGIEVSTIPWVDKSEN